MWSERCWDRKEKVIFPWLLDIWFETVKEQERRKKKGKQIKTKEWNLVVFWFLDDACVQAVCTVPYVTGLRLQFLVTAGLHTRHTQVEALHMLNINILFYQCGKIEREIRNGSSYMGSPLAVEVGRRPSVRLASTDRWFDNVTDSSSRRVDSRCPVSVSLSVSDQWLRAVLTRCRRLRINS